MCHLVFYANSDRFKVLYWHELKHKASTCMKPSFFYLFIYLFSFALKPLPYLLHQMKVCQNFQKLFSICIAKDKLLLRDTFFILKTCLFISNSSVLILPFPVLSVYHLYFKRLKDYKTVKS